MKKSQAPTLPVTDVLTKPAEGSTPTTKLTWTVTPPLTGEGQLESRADLALFEWAKSPGSGLSEPFTRSQIQRLIREQKILVNDRPTKANARLHPKDVVSIEIPHPESSALVAEDRALEILFEDEFILVLNKPPGLTVHPSPSQLTGTLVHALLYHIKDLSGIGGILRPGIVHRIDKDTSGVLVVTKTDAAHTKLSAAFSKHDIERTYWALCYGGGPLPRSLSTLIGRSPSDRKKMSIQVKDGKKAITHLKLLKEFSIPGQKPFASWVEATLETGRTHQVRVHLTSLEHSLLGDPVYGTPRPSQPKWKALPSAIQSLVAKLPGQALHARSLGFIHPMTGERLRFEGELPPAMHELLQALTQSYA